MYTKNEHCHAADECKNGTRNVQEVFHVYLNKFKIAVSHLFLIIFSNDEFTSVNLISRDAQSPRK